jgi:predicted TPR repeat methyltransferase
MAARSSDESDPLSRAQALIAAGKAREACVLLKSQLDRGRGGLLTRIALGRALIAAKDNDAALALLRETTALAPGVAEVALALGEALLACGHIPTALAEFERALRLEPNLVGAHFALGSTWLEAGEPLRAIEFLAPLVKDDSPLGSAAAQKLAQAEAMQAADRSPEGYVRHLFDQFSANYDERMLDNLGYQAHRILRRLADLVVAASEGSFAILDLGCGTGLSGEAFKAMASRLDGIDLSPRMLDEARRRGIYDDLLLGDAATVLETRSSSYDLVLAADTLVYLGDLTPVVDGVRKRLRPGGVFLFTVERKTGDGYELGPKRRYRHSEAYLRSEAERAGFEVVGLIECVPRLEAGVPVEGFAVALQGLEPGR